MQQAVTERLLTVQGLQDERVAGRVESHEVDMPMDMNVQLYLREHRFMSGRGRKIFAESRMSSYWRGPRHCSRRTQLAWRLC